MEYLQLDRMKLAVILQIISSVSVFTAGVIILISPLLGALLLVIYGILSFISWKNKKRADERKEQFNFDLAKSVVSESKENPYRAQLDRDLKESARLENFIPRYIEVFEVDNSDTDALSNIVVGYGVLLNHQVALYGKAQRETLIEADKYVTIALQKLKYNWDTETLLGIAVIFDAGKYFVKSRKIYETLIKREPKNINVIDCYGMSCLMSKRVFDADLMLSKAVSGGNLTFLTLYNLGAVKHELGHFSASNVYLKISFNLFRNWNTLRLMSQNYFKMGYFKESFVFHLAGLIKGGFGMKSGINEALFTLRCSFSFGLSLFLSFTIGKVPYLGNVYYKLFRPSEKFHSLVKKQLDEHITPYYESIKLLERLLLIEPTSNILKYNIGVMNGKLGKKQIMLDWFSQIDEDELFEKSVRDLSHLSEAELKEQPIEQQEHKR